MQPADGLGAGAPSDGTKVQWACEAPSLRFAAESRSCERNSQMNGVFTLIGVVVVAMFVLGYFGLR